MKIGNLRHRVTLLRRQQGRDEMGQPIDVWAPVRIVWAEVRDLSGQRLWAAQQVRAKAHTEVRLRWTADISETWRIQHGHRTLEIIGIPADPDGRRRELICTCREVRP